MEMLLSQNRMLTMELQNLLLAIALAKVNIVSPSILDHADLEGMWMEEPTDTPIKVILSILKGENGTVSSHRYKNIQVQFNEQQRLAFQK